MTEFRMPALGADMEAGTLVEWLKHPGETVSRGDIIAVVDTEKGAIEVEVFEDGVVDRLLVEPGQKTPVGEVLAIIRAPGEPAGEVPRPAATGPPARALVSPAARKAAERLGVALASVAGSGPGGSITVADVERAAGPASATPAGAAPVSAAAASAAPASATPAVDRVSGMRAAVGAAMARSKREIPHLYLSTTVDLTPALTWLARENERRAVAERLLPAVLFIRAVGRACAETPEMNGYWTGQGFQAGTGVHVGCAIALRGGGLVAPALRDVNTKSLEAVARDFTDLVKRARAGALRSSEMSDATITVTNLGDLGAEAAYAIIYPPQVAIVGFGRVVVRPWVVEDRIEPRSVVTITVSADHRAVDGRGAGTFLAAVARALQSPDTA